MGGPGPLSGPMWVVLDRSQGLCGRSWAVLVPLLAVLGHLGSALGVYVGGIGWRLLRPLLAVLSRLALKKVEEHDHLENVLISQAGEQSAAWRAVLSRS